MIYVLNDLGEWLYTFENEGEFDEFLGRVGFDMGWHIVEK